jgi:hypothetical protein
MVQSPNNKGRLPRLKRGLRQAVSVKARSTKPKKDHWDKAAIVSSFLSSVVIAVIGIWINFSIQESQIRTSSANAKAQVEVADKNTAAQIQLAERTAENQRRIQEGSLTGQLVDHLTSDNPLKRRIAIVALRGAVPGEMYQNVISMVVSADPNEQVRETALQQAGTIRDPGADLSRAVALTVTDESKPASERALAAQSAGSLAITAAAPRNTFIIAATSPKEAASDNGIFARTLIQGLAGLSDANHDGLITAPEIGYFITNQIPIMTSGMQHPIFMATGFGKDDVLFGQNTNYHQKLALLIGNASAGNNQHVLAGVARDISHVREFLQQQGVAVTHLQDISAAQAIEQFQRFSKIIKENDLFMLYFAGHSDIDRSTGVPAWIFADGSKLSAAEVNLFLRGLAARVSVLFADTSFSHPPLNGRSIK